MLGAVILQIVLILCNAAFSAAEAAVTDLNDSQLEERAKNGNAQAEKLLKMKRSQSRFLTTMRLLITFCGYLGSAYAAVCFRQPFEEWLTGCGLKLDEGAAVVPETAALALILSLAMLVLGYLVPRGLATKNTRRAAEVLCGPVGLLYTVFFPLVWLVTVVSHGILRLFHIDPNEQDEVTEEEIRLIVESGSQMGAIDSQENEFIQNVFEFNDVSVDEVCTHRKDAVCVYLEDDKEAWDKVIYENKHSFYLVCGEDTDDIAGVLDARDYFRLKDYSRENVMATCVHKPYFIPENMKAASLFRNMKKTGNYFAVAIDEYGGMAGIVTMRDLLELIVGEWKEKDEEPEPEDIRKVHDNIWHIRGAASLDEVAKELETQLPVDEFDTFGGYILGELGYVPDDGSTLSLEAGELIIQVKSVEDHRIEDTVVKKKLVDEQERKEAEK